MKTMSETSYHILQLWNCVNTWEDCVLWTLKKKNICNTFLFEVFSKSKLRLNSWNTQYWQNVTCICNNILSVKHILLEYFRDRISENEHRGEQWTSTVNRKRVSSLWTYSSLQGAILAIICLSDCFLSFGGGAFLLLQLLFSIVNRAMERMLCINHPHTFPIWETYRSVVLVLLYSSKCSELCESRGGRPRLPVRAVSK